MLSDGHIFKQNVVLRAVADGLPGLHELVDDVVFADACHPICGGALPRQHISAENVTTAIVI